MLRDPRSRHGGNDHVRGCAGGGYSVVIGDEINLEANGGNEIGQFPAAVAAVDDGDVGYAKFRKRPQGGAGGAAGTNDDGGSELRAGGVEKRADGAGDAIAIGVVGTPTITTAHQGIGRAYELGTVGAVSCNGKRRELSGHGHRKTPK